MKEILGGLYYHLKLCGGLRGLCFAEANFEAKRSSVRPSNGKKCTQSIVSSIVVNVLDTRSSASSEGR